MDKCISVFVYLADFAEFQSSEPRFFRASILRELLRVLPNCSSQVVLFLRRARSMLPVQTLGKPSEDKAGNYLRQILLQQGIDLHNKLAFITIG